MKKYNIYIYKEQKERHFNFAIFFQLINRTAFAELQIFMQIQTFMNIIK